MIKDVYLDNLCARFTCTDNLLYGELAGKEIAAAVVLFNGHFVKC